jgi:lipopolysaccharide export system permease protein
VSFWRSRSGQLADEQKAIAKYSNMSFAGAGAWIRDGDTILSVQDRSSAAEFGGMLIFELTPDNRLAAIARAEHATAAGPQSWLLRNYAESRFVDDSVTSLRVAQQPLHTAAGADFLRLVNTDSSELSLRTLYKAIRYLRANNLESEQYEIAFWSRVARTVGILVALLFALPFGFGSLRTASLSARSHLRRGAGDRLRVSAAAGRKRHAGIQPGSAAAGVGADRAAGAGHGDDDLARALARHARLYRR